MKTCIKCERPIEICVCGGEVKNYYSKLAKIQNMEIARCKAIDIMDFMIGSSTLNSDELGGMSWRDVRREIMAIIIKK